MIAEAKSINNTIEIKIGVDGFVLNLEDVEAFSEELQKAITESRRYEMVENLIELINKIYPDFDTRLICCEEVMEYTVKPNKVIILGNIEEEYRTVIIDKKGHHML